MEDVQAQKVFCFMLFYSCKNNKLEIMLEEEQPHVKTAVVVVWLMRATAFFSILYLLCDRFMFELIYVPQRFATFVFEIAFEILFIRFSFSTTHLLQLNWGVFGFMYIRKDHGSDPVC